MGKLESKGDKKSLADIGAPNAAELAGAIVKSGVVTEESAAEAVLQAALLELGMEQKKDKPYP